MIDLSAIPMPSLPTDDEMHEMMLPRWNDQAMATIDSWPASVAALSVPTTLIPIDLETADAIYEPTHPRWREIMDGYAAAIDAVTGWDRHFIRLSTRSPKDAAPDALPITMSGKQAMDWIANSERCMDDIAMAKWAKKPIFIAVREAYIAPKGGEFRCFAKDGRLLAMSRYIQDDTVIDYGDFDLFGQARDFYETHLAEHYDTIVFDLQFGAQVRGVDGRYEQREMPLLVELNPYGLSHPCLFEDYDEIETEGGLRV